MVDGYSMGARNQHKAGGAYEFHIHRAYIIYGYTRHKISVLMVLFIEAYDEIPFAQNGPSIETSIHISFFSVFFITPLYKNVHNSFVVHPIELY